MKLGTYRVLPHFARRRHDYRNICPHCRVTCDYRYQAIPSVVRTYAVKLVPAEHADAIYCYLFKSTPVVSSLQIYAFVGQPVA